MIPRPICRPSASQTEFVPVMFLPSRRGHAGEISREGLSCHRREPGGRARRGAGAGGGGRDGPLTGRTLREGEHPEGLDRGGSLASVLEAAKAYPGKVTAHRVDHSQRRGDRSHRPRGASPTEGRLDVLVNYAWPGYENMVEGDPFTWVDPLWDQPMWRWDAMIRCRRALSLLRHPHRSRDDGAAAPRAHRQHLLLGRAEVHGERRLRHLQGRDGQDGGRCRHADARVRRRRGVALSRPCPHRGGDEEQEYFDMSNSESRSSRAAPWPGSQPIRS